MNAGKATGKTFKVPNIPFFATHKTRDNCPTLETRAKIVTFAMVVSSFLIHNGTSGPALFYAGYTQKR